MIKIAEIEPSKKYVIVMPGASKEQALLFEHRLRQFKKGVVIVYGLDVTIVPADQIAGYTTLE